jgi:alpha-ketoglutarate-dependent taurine dioxygenase
MQFIHLGTNVSLANALTVLDVTKNPGSDDTILDLWGVGPNRAPIDTHHPAVRTHPVTGLKALNINPGFVTGFAEMNKKESGKRYEQIFSNCRADI